MVVGPVVVGPVVVGPVVVGPVVVGACGLIEKSVDRVRPSGQKAVHVTLTAASVTVTVS